MRLDSGQLGVLATVQYRPRLSQGSRADRRAALQEAFASAVAPILQRIGGDWDPDSVNVSAQTVKVLIPYDSYGKVEGELPPGSFRIDELLDRQVVQEAAGGAA